MDDAATQEEPKATFGVVCDRCGMKYEESGDTIKEAFDKLHETAPKLGWKIAARSGHGTQALVEIGKITGHATSRVLDDLDLCPSCNQEERN